MKTVRRNPAAILGGVVIILLGAIVLLSALITPTYLGALFGLR